MFMILIDTSMWVEFFRKQGSLLLKQRVATLLELDQAVYTCPIYFEVLAGAHDPELELIEETFALSERIFFQSKHWLIAAELERRLRKKGVTVPRDDLFVATIAHEMKLPLVCKDQHFDLIHEKGNFSLKIEQFG